MPSDFKVKRLSYSDLAETAQRLRALGRIRSEQKTFDIVDLLHNAVIPALENMQKRFTIEVDNFMENAAEVDLERQVLYLPDGLLLSARSGNFRARLILAHEIAHMILHQDQVMAFSADKAVQLNYLEPEDSAERQAQDFALLLLLPDDVIIATRNMTKESASIVTLVEPKLIEERRRDFEVHNRVYLSSYTDLMCSCGNKSVVRLGSSMLCKSCGGPI